MNGGPPWHEAIGLYGVMLRAGGRSPGTVRLHRHYLHRLAAMHPDPWVLTVGDLRRALDVPHWSAEARKSARSVYCGFYRWALTEGFVTVDPALGLAPVTVPMGKPRPAPEHVLAEALTRADPRERIMLLLAAYAGLRCAEIASVRPRNLIDGLLHVTGKGGKTRVIPIEHPEILDALASTDEWLFPNGFGGHLSPGHVTKLLSRVLPGKWTGHTLRHRFASRAYAVTRDTFALGAVLGHSRPETTLRYVLLPPDALRQVVRGAA